MPGQGAVLCWSRGTGWRADDRSGAKCEGARPAAGGTRTPTASTRRSAAPRPAAPAHPAARSANTRHHAGAPTWERVAGQGNPSPHAGEASGPHSRSVQGSPATNWWSCGSTRVSEIDQPSRTSPLPDLCAGPSLPSTHPKSGRQKNSPRPMENGHKGPSEIK